MNTFELVFFAICAFFCMAGAIWTVAAPNPIRGAIGLLSTIIGIAGLYLMLTAEFLAVVQIAVYAGAVVVLFLFVIMLLGPNARSPQDARGAISRYLGAGLFLVSGLAALVLVLRFASGNTALLEPAPEMGTVEAIGREMFSGYLIPFEISGILLLIAVVGAVAIARGRQPDPTMGERSTSIPEMRRLEAKKRRALAEEKGAAS
jgi:NADH-quinone oxidoreductase subunit J